LVVSRETALYTIAKLAADRLLRDTMKCAIKSVDEKNQRLAITYDVKV
jgi:hypothetical protein